MAVCFFFAMKLWTLISRFQLFSVFLCSHSRKRYYRFLLGNLKYRALCPGIFKVLSKVSNLYFVCSSPLSTRIRLRGRGGAAELLKFSLPRFYLSSSADCHLFKAASAWLRSPKAMNKCDTLVRERRGSIGCHVDFKWNGLEDLYEIIHEIQPWLIS